jgi:hypothetical protein
MNNSSASATTSRPADAPLSLSEEKKILQDRRRQLEASLQSHVTELRDRGRQVGQIALVGAGALAGVWLVSKVIGTLNGGRKRRKARALLAATPSEGTISPAAASASVPAGPSLVQTLLDSDIGRVVTSQLVAMLMVFITRKVEAFLQIDNSADIGSVKESELAPYRIIHPVADANIIPDDTVEPARPHVAYPSPNA